jgi:CRISPR/Cas system type I-B associated protein Csh2 (Cas7 group RAMP superfamily)
VWQSFANLQIEKIKDAVFMAFNCHIVGKMDKNWRILMKFQWAANGIEG